MKRLLITSGVALFAMSVSAQAAAWEWWHVFFPLPSLIPGYW